MRLDRGRKHATYLLQEIVASLDLVHQRGDGVALAEKSTYMARSVGHGGSGSGSVA
jgi:hypothetical protein